MQYDEELRQVTEDVFTTMIGPAPVLVENEAPAPESIAATVRITGAWSGAVTVCGSLKLARLAAGAMFGLPPDEAGDAEVRDAIGELGNMIGGNVKSLLGGECVLSIPCVATDGGAQFAGTPVGRAAFDIEGEPFTVTMAAG
jgi:chemotaxis protein CheX